ncbi:MAG: cyclic nucleotide-binding domain-containing protein, partial [Kiritimatiellaceae bacterium]|nr:cyclic nucleotide-binding domain-containing protein [Kiritimatiellaceae bacterium]
HGENGQEHFLTDLSSGALFGEMAYLLGEGRTATAVATTPVLVLVLPPEMLETLMRQSSRVSRDIIRSLCSRLEHMNQAAVA